MAARVESQAGGTDDGAAPSIPSAFKNKLMLGVTEAIMWIACRRHFSHETIREHLERHRDRGQWHYGRSQLSRPLQRRAEKAERQLISLIIGGVPAIGMLDHEGRPDHHERIPVPVEFLKYGAYIELLSGHVRADPLLDKHAGYQRPTYRDVDIDRDAFFKALAAAEPRSQATDRGNEQKTFPASTRRRAVFPCGSLAEVQLDFWTPEQIAKFIVIEQAFAEFCEADPEMRKLDSAKPDPERDPKDKDIEKWLAQDVATIRFVEHFRKEILVARALYNDEERILPPDFWASPLTPLTITAGRVRGLSHDDPDRHLENSRVVLRREEWGKWINEAMPDSRRGLQEADARSNQQQKKAPKPRGGGGRKPGSGAYTDQDRVLWEKMKVALKEKDAVSPWDAAGLFADGAPGRGTEDSKRRRLVTGYKRWLGTQ